MCFVNFKNDIDLVKYLLTDYSKLQVTSTDNDTRLVNDFKDALNSVLYMLDDKDGEIMELQDQIDEHQKEMNEMLKHIKKLERMLNKRDIKFKTWDEVREEMF